MPFIGRPWSKHHLTYIYTPRRPLWTTPFTCRWASQPEHHRAFSPKHHRPTRRPSMNRLNRHQNRYLPGGRANACLGSRYAVESATDTHLLPHILLIQSPHTVPSLIPPQHAILGRAATQVQNAARQLLHHHSVMPRREKRSRPRETVKGTEKNRMEKRKEPKHHPVGAPAPYTPLLLYAPVAKKYIQLDALVMSASCPMPITPQRPVLRLCVKVSETSAAPRGRIPIFRRILIL